MAGKVDHAAYDAILHRCVHEGLVDYLTLRKEDAAALQAYLERLADVDPQTLPRAEQLTFYINLYNATMLQAVVQRVRVDYTPAENDFAVFDEPLVRLHGRRVSLNDLENKIIRPTFHEPRVHAALACAARSCPPLSAEAYTGEKLDDQLEQRMRLFLLDPTRNRVDRKQRRLELSQVFQWYAEDFGGKDQLPAYVGRYAGIDLHGFTVSFLKYSWQLNMSRPQGGRWIRVASSEAKALRRPETGAPVLGSAARGALYEVVGQRGGFLHVDRPLEGNTAWLLKRDTAAY